MDSNQQRRRARCSRRSHGSLDQQPNDRLGWIRRQLFEYWRQIQPDYRQLDSYKYHGRTRRPRLSHRSLDRQPNDHLGRSCFRPHLFEHRRQILRGFIESDTDANSNRNGYANCNTNTHSDCNRNCDSNAERDSESYSHSQVSADAATAPDSGTPPIKMLISDRSLVNRSTADQRLAEKLRLLSSAGPLYINR